MVQTVAAEVLLLERTLAVAPTLCSLGFTEAETNAIINRISQGQSQREAIAVVARARASNEGYSADVANRVASIVVGPPYVSYPNALLKVRQTIQQGNARSVNDDDDDEEDDDDEDDDDDDEEEEDEDDDTEPTTVSRQGGLAQAPQQQRQYAR
jgi:hypothetical protein